MNYKKDVVSTCEEAIKTLRKIFKTNIEMPEFPETLSTLECSWTIQKSSKVGNEVKRDNATTALYAAVEAIEAQIKRIEPFFLAYEGQPDHIRVYVDQDELSLGDIRLIHFVLTGIVDDLNEIMDAADAATFPLRGKKVHVGRKVL